MFIDLSEFIYRHSAFIARAYELSGAARSALITKCGDATARQTWAPPQDIADGILFPMKNGFVTRFTLMIEGGRLLA